jgi:hypothetical protein
MQHVFNWDYYQLGSGFLFVTYGNIMLTLVLVSESYFFLLVCILKFAFVNKRVFLANVSTVSLRRLLGQSVYKENGTYIEK